MAFLPLLSRGDETEGHHNHLFSIMVEDIRFNSNKINHVVYWSVGLCVISWFIDWMKDCHVVVVVNVIIDVLAAIVVVVVFVVAVVVFFVVVVFVVVVYVVVVVVYVGGLGGDGVFVLVDTVSLLSLLFISLACCCLLRLL